MCRALCSLVCVVSALLASGCSGTTDLVSARALASMDARGQRIAIEAEVQDLSYWIEDANPTEYSWEGLRLGLDTDRLRGDAVWIELDPSIEGPLLVDPTEGAARVVKLAGGGMIVVRANPDGEEIFGGRVRMFGEWRSEELRSAPILFVDRVERAPERFLWSKRAQQAIDEEADRRLEAASSIRDRAQRSVAIDNAMYALQIASVAQFSLIMAEAAGTLKDVETSLRVIEGYAGDRAGW